MRYYAAKTTTTGAIAAAAGRAYGGDPATKRRVFLLKLSPWVGTALCGADELPTRFSAITFAAKVEAIEAARVIDGPGRRVAIAASE